MPKNIREFTPEEKIQRAYDMIQIKNVMGRHAYLHACNRHDIEMEICWAHNAPNISWGNAGGFQIGRDVVWSFYVKPHIGHGPKPGEGQMHTLTTPLIEIAGDGQTAQAMWYTPGYICGHGGPMDPDDAPLRNCLKGSAVSAGIAKIVRPEAAPDDKGQHDQQRRKHRQTRPRLVMANAGHAPAIGAHHRNQQSAGKHPNQQPPEVCQGHVMLLTVSCIIAATVRATTCFLSKRCSTSCRPRWPMSDCCRKDCSANVRMAWVSRSASFAGHR